MKIVKLPVLFVLFLLLSVFGFKNFIGGSIKGIVSPANGATKVLAISTTDTAFSTINQGVFELVNIKSGMYKVIIQAVEPYESFIKEGVQVTDGSITDLGQINLKKIATEF